MELIKDVINNHVSKNGEPGDSFIKVPFEILYEQENDIKINEIEIKDCLEENLNKEFNFKINIELV